MIRAMRGAWAKLTGRLFWGQWIGNLVVMLLAAMWLQVPDSHSWQFAFSMLAAVLLVIAFCWIYVTTFRTLRFCTPRPAHWRSWLWLLLFVALWWGLLRPIAAGRAYEGLYAGYWNSQSPPWLRHLLGYSGLVAWQERIYDCVEWLWGGLLLPPAIELCACGPGAGWFRRVARVYGYWLYWLAVLVFGFVSSALTWALAGWVPSFGLVGQTVSIAARLGLAYTLDVGLWCFLLALVAYYFDRPTSPEPRP